MGNFFEWRYMRPISISPSIPRADFQIKIELTPENFDYAKAKPNGEDLRFVQPDGILLPYWIEKWDPSGRSIIWVKVHTAGLDRIAMYYGNPSADPRSDGEATFEFFDDFETDLSKWVQIKTSSTSVINRTTAKAYEGLYSVEVYQTKDDGDTILSKQFDFSQTGIIEIMFYDDISVTGTQAVGASSFYGGFMSASSNNYWYREAGLWHDTGISRSTGWHAFKFVFSGSNAEFYIDGMLAGSSTSVTEFSNVRIMSYWSVSGPGIYCDLIRIRKYATFEPITTIGDEITIMRENITLKSAITREICLKSAITREVHLKSTITREVTLKSKLK